MQLGATICNHSASDDTLEAVAACSDQSDAMKESICTQCDDAMAEGSLHSVVCSNGS